MPKKKKGEKFKFKTHKATTKRFRVTSSGKNNAHQRRPRALSVTQIKTRKITIHENASGQGGTPQMAHQKMSIISKIQSRWCN
jgi:hypothetical protein